MQGQGQGRGGKATRDHPQAVMGGRGVGVGEREERGSRPRRTHEQRVKVVEEEALVGRGAEQRGEGLL